MLLLPLSVRLELRRLDLRVGLGSPERESERPTDEFWHTWDARLRPTAASPPPPTARASAASRTSCHSRRRRRRQKLTKVNSLLQAVGRQLHRETEALRVEPGTWPQSVGGEGGGEWIWRKLGEIPRWPRQKMLRLKRGLCEKIERGAFVFDPFCRLTIG